ncbi:hypothetical protein [Enterococcus faecalis]|uniref:hypothetical protein n=1 Tax=Enterococcus faecalis TaxID=1351 RepID=UPI0003AAF904|nr:hypothetical protein [Enterococcus faecalis]
MFANEAKYLVFSGWDNNAAVYNVTIATFQAFYIWSFQEDKTRKSIYHYLPNKEVST